MTAMCECSKIVNNRVIVSKDLFEESNLTEVLLIKILCSY